MKFIDGYERFADKNKYYGHVSTKDGLTSFTLDNKQAFQKRLLELVGKDVEITIEEANGHSHSPGTTKESTGTN